MKKRTLSFFLCLAMVISLFVQAFPAAVAAEADGTVTILRDGEAVSALSLPREEKTTLTASFAGTGDCQWQILLSPESEQWVDIYDKTAPDCEVSYALVKTMLDDSGSAWLRCAVTGETAVYSETVCVTVLPGEQSAEEPVGVTSAPLAPAPLPAPVAEVTEPAEEVEEFLAMAEMTAFTLLADGDSAPDEDKTIYTVTIEYVYGADSKFAGQRVALPYIAEIPDGGTLESVDSPECVGYAPDIATYTFTDPIKGNLNYTVEYSPAKVSYTVRHYQQNVDNDDYTQVDTTLATGYTESLTSDAAAKDYEGFTALTHFHEEIAADGSTMIDIYYDRDYYLMSFNLNGGYGVEPIYARYGTPISVGTPTKTGWTFAGWSATIPSTMPAENKTYTATWTANSGIPFTVAYWLEDANTDGKYNFWGSTQLTEEAGATVQGATYRDYTTYLDAETVNKMDTYEKRYSYYDHADTDVVIKGDGTTVVNVYYKRNEYTLKFYYAMSSGSGTNTTYYVIGGSTYYFGKASKISDAYKGDEVKLLDAYMSSHTGTRGQVDEKPTLNTNGSTRGYKEGTDTSKVNNTTEYNYYYISFNAKYGEDISNLWPCNVFNSVTRSSNNSGSWTGTEAFVSAWNGEHHVYYSQIHGKDEYTGNQTIKGNYNELDYQLLWHYTEYGDSDTVAYLCFWENGADIGWSVPELYRYNVYVPVLTGQEPNQTDDGKYYLWATYDTCDNSTVGEQTAPAINGYTYTDTYTSAALHKYNGDDPTKNIIATKNDSPILFDEDGNRIYREAYEVNFFYTRDQYTLTFVNGNTTAKEESVYFGADISGKAPTGLEYYEEDLKDLYTFDGWYTSPGLLDGSEFDLTGATMPANPLTLYAKWNLITHNVSVYPTEEDAENCTNQIDTTVAVTHDEPVPEDARPATPASTEENTFIGWFYKDENGDEQAFDFATMPITQDMTVYAKWRSNASKDVTIHYVVEENGVQTPIADPETIKLRVGQTRTFEAKTGIALYADYRTGCFPTTATHSITPTETSTEEDLTYTFVYKQYGKVPYQVKFTIEKDGTTHPAFRVENGEPVFVEAGQWSESYIEYFEQHWDNNKAVVVELFEPDVFADKGLALPGGYIPNALKLQKVIVPSETNPETNIAANTIEFIYTYTEKVEDPDDPDQKLYPAKYLVQHFIQNVQNTDTYDLYSWVTHEGLETKIATASPITIPGYTYSYDVTETHMDIYNDERKWNEELDDDDIAKMQNALTQNPDSMSGTITADDSLELNFYYTANAYPYRVLYLEEGTNQQVKEPKTGETALFGATVTETAPEIKDYDVVGSSTKSIQIKMEAGTSAQVNTITFYYARKNADLIISKTVKLDPDQAKEEGIDTLPESATTQEFSFNIFCPTGFNKLRYDYTIKEDGEEDITGKVQITDGFNMTVTLKHGQTIQIHELIMGEYTITETYVPGFRITVDGGTDAQQKENVSVTAELVEANKDVQVDFTNSYPFFTGELVLGKTVTKADSTDPNATEPYKVTVTLNPAAETREVDRVITWTDADNTARTVTIPKLKNDGTDTTTFIFEVLVPVDGTVTLSGVPAGDFTAEETVKGTVGYISDYYSVKTYSKQHNNEDTATANGAKVSSVIHGGHPTTVTFGNTYKKGDLTIHKTVTQEYVNDNWQSDTFTFAITGTTALPAGTYYVTIGGKETTVTVDADGKVTVEDVTIMVTKTEGATQWSGSLAIENLPAGYYTVTETAGLGNDKYTAAGPTESLLVNNTTTPTVANFTNTYKRTTGNLQVSKNIEIVGDGYTIDTNQEFTFTVKLTDSTLSGEYTCTDGKKLTAAADGTLTFKLKHGESITINGLPVGVYEITETQVEHYGSHFNGATSADVSTTAIVTTGETAVVSCVNKYPVDMGKLTVKKTVVTPDDFSAANKAPEGDEFTFVVTITPNSNLANLSAGVTAKFSGSESAKLLTVTDNTVTFTLEHNESVELELPACDYTVKETTLTSTVNTTGGLADHYTTTVGDTTGTSASGTLVADGDVTVAFTNTYKLHYANLTIDNKNSPDEAEQVYVYEVKSKTTDLAITVTVVGNKQTTIHNLPVGEYTVTQQDDWSWRYSSNASSGATITLDGDKTLEVLQKVKNGKWLDGVSKLVKNVKGG